MDKTSFIFHTEWGRLFRRLSDADCKRLLQMMCDYAADSIEPEDTPDMVGMAFDCIRGLMDFDKERYNATCEKRRQAVQKRWDKQKQKDTEQEQEGTKNTNVSTCIDGDTKHTYSESYSESESYSDSESECIINNTHTHTHAHESTADEVNQAHAIPNSNQVQAYAREQQAVTSPERFYNYFAANGWVDSKNRPIQNWQATFRYWDIQDMEKVNSKQKPALSASNAAIYEELIHTPSPLSLQKNKAVSA